MRTLSCLLLTLAALTSIHAADEKPAKKKPTVSGKVEFARKPTFADGTVVMIQVQDTSIADRKAVVLGEKVIKNPKAGPIEFEIEYDGDRIKPRGRYSISCRITLDGKLL